jgi:hypothetical protein
VKLYLVKIKARKGETTVDTGPSRLGVSEALPGQDQGEEGRDHCGYLTLQILKIRHGLKKAFRTYDLHLYSQ